MGISVILDLIGVVRGTVRKNNSFAPISTLFFLTIFSFFPQKKRTLERTETEQADSKLRFATKIIKKYLLVFVNELFGDAMRVSKQWQK